MKTLDDFKDIIAFVIVVIYSIARFALMWWIYAWLAPVSWYHFEFWHGFVALIGARMFLKDLFDFRKNE